MQLTTNYYLLSTNKCVPLEGGTPTDVGELTMHTIERNRFAVTLFTLVLAGLPGCSLPKSPAKIFSLDSSWPWKDDEPQVEVPTRVVGMWTDTVLNKAGEKPQRGFGGRLMFYGQDPNKPVIVDGELVVYAFDETGREPTDNKPTRRYVFPADQISLHHSKSPVGPSYSFWLPWDEAGGPRTEISLICRFQPKGGAVVVSEQTRHLLPGALPAAVAVAGHSAPKLPEGVPSRPALPQLSSQLSSQATNTPAAGGAQLASYEVPDVSAAPNVPVGAIADAPVPVRSMTTTSIRLPADFQIPHGTVSVPAAGAGAAMPQNLAPALQSVMPLGGQQLAPSGGAAYPAAAGVQSASGPSQIGRSIAAYQPQPRPVSPPVYNPTYVPAPNNHGLNQPLPVPAPYALNPARIVQPQLAPQPGQATQQPTQPNYARQPMTWPQSAPQMTQVPASGAANDTYR
jgi:hypothetical protein